MARIDSTVEIGHVLTMDVVEYSKLFITDQTRVMAELTRIVTDTGQFRVADDEGKLIRIPTGDGMALVFFGDPQAPIQCAIEIATALKKHPAIRLRMGIHSGPVSRVVDVSGRANVAGAGIDIAQRVMDCGDAGHILLSRRAAEDLVPFPDWNAHLHELGECEVKHGRKISLLNFYADEIGNLQRPQKCLTTATARPSKDRWAMQWAGGTILLLVVLVGWWWSFGKPRNRMNTTLLPQKSIAVLPFENLSRDPDTAYFADGIQEEILTRLSKIADLKVISRTSTQRFKSAPSNLREIANQLGVAHILEGAVQKADDRVRLNVQLINAQTDSHRWADQYDRRLTDIFAVESDIATHVASALEAQLTGSEKHAISAHPTDNPVAYRDYLKGRYFWNKRTGDGFKTAMTYFQQAIDNDPNFSLAYAGLADTYVLLPAFTGAAPQDAMPKAKVAAQRALELDDTLAEAHTSLGMVLRAYDFDYAGAVAEFKRAIELNPNYAPAHYWFGTHVLSALGRFEEAIAEVKRAIELDPLSLVANVDLGTTYVYARQFDDAITQLRKAIELDDNFYYAHYELGIALQCKGSIDAAIAEFEKAHRLSDDPSVCGLLGQAYAVRGRRDDALKMLAQLRDQIAHRNVPAYNFAIIYLGLGDKDEALRWLEKDFSNRDGWNIGFIKVDPLLDLLRGDPHFEKLKNQVVPADSN